MASRTALRAIDVFSMVVSFERGVDVYRIERKVRERHRAAILTPARGSRGPSRLVSWHEISSGALFSPRRYDQNGHAVV
jgi:hypothetical protein